MKTAIQEVIDIIEMEHNNGVEISQKLLWKMLNNAKEKEKQHIINAHEAGQNIIDEGAFFTDSNSYYNETFKP